MVGRDGLQQEKIPPTLTYQVQGVVKQLILSYRYRPRDTDPVTQASSEEGEGRVYAVSLNVGVPQNRQ